MSIVVLLGLLALLLWLGVALHPARPWDFHPVGDDNDLPTPPSVWPSVSILVPARNESETLPQTLPALLRQDYPGPFTVVVIDDRSHDGTAEVARQIAHSIGHTERLVVISGAELPPGWVGKVWALEQGALACGVASSSTVNLQNSTPTPAPRYLLLTDADIHHAQRSLRRLVAESEQETLGLNSRMARLRCRSFAEQLLIPPFVFFFNLLYPMRQVNDPCSSVAAAAGGCVLLSTSALRHAGGFACIKDRIIDDVSLATHIKHTGSAIRLALSRTEVQSLRVYDSLAMIWVMVRRTAFTELRYSWLRLVGSVLGLALMFVVPPVLTASGVGLWGASVVGMASSPSIWGLVLASVGIGSWGLMAVVYAPAVRFYELPFVRVWMFPLAGMLYGAMTIDSALRYVLRMRIGWRDR
ncbi:MAG: glycosyltransferase [Candidatus Binatia bacterium]